ncbi:putative bifunctional diguanylate cyclase/phosphodiesterase [Falsirhodobacter xinxiangensis]|uniref:putative bifunctional diguanylate cyclase/phosphodiesterase n=1 Tax=Falsirhodobacter xinxiangensis TaxID=2530049 RepID=UPI0010AA201D|nr:EAL domain-containing protein [Rhodobacter xinxiangensis]
MGLEMRPGALRALLRRPEVLAVQPLFMLAAFWLGGERALIALAIGQPTLIFALMLLRQEHGSVMVDDISQIAPRPQVLRALDAALSDSSTRATACLVVQIDDAAELVDQHGRAAQTEILARAAERLCRALRYEDVVARLEGGGFAVALAPVRRLDIESLIQLAARLQAAFAPPFELQSARIHLSCSIGFCSLDRAPGRDAASLLDAAQVAADDALRHGPGAIRAYSAEIARTRIDRDSLREALEHALDSGQIRPHFQPQVCTETGSVTGFEALARWYHPTRGIVPPAEFLPALDAAGLTERLGEVMLAQSLTALKKWDAAGMAVPTVAVNFSAAELRNPALTDKLRWELDRHDLEPERLSVEVLETVVAHTDNDLIVRNISELSRMGCGIDLDDFGTGHASITNIRRFAVRRLKIDRSFVSRVDEDREQQRIVAAILSLAERLGLGTLAEGVEGEGEQAMLARLGCGHVQGFGIARPMPFEDTLAWIANHRARLVPMEIPTQL